MQRPLPWFWMALAGLLLLAPSPAGRVLLDVLGGITLTLLLVPLVLGAAGFVAWQILQRRLRTCPVCSFTSVGLEVCPACGYAFSEDASPETTVRPLEIDARDATIDVQVLSDDD